MMKDVENTKALFFLCLGVFEVYILSIVGSTIPYPEPRTEYRLVPDSRFKKKIVKFGINGQDVSGGNQDSAGDGSRH